MRQSTRRNIRVRPAGEHSSLGVVRETKANWLRIIVACWAVGAWSVPKEALACNQSPPQPICSKSTAIIKAVPAVIVVGPGGGVASIPVLVFNSRFSNGIGNCGFPASIKVTLTLTCFTLPFPGAPAPGGMGMTTVPVPSPGVPGLGANVISVPVVIAPGPVPRFCVVSGTVMTTWTDGMVTTAVGDTVICLAEPSPADPSLPRLDLELLTPAIQSAHAGDQRINAYRLTNNDPTESVTVTINADSEQTGRMPGLMGAVPPPGSGMGVHSLADPGQGDNFPIAFLEDLPLPCPCVPLPPNPSGTPIPMISKTVTLGPGECLPIKLAVRSWPGCRFGCSENRVRVEGTFSDGTAALACAGSALLVDNTIPPDFECPDGGSVGIAQPMPPNMSLIQASLPTHDLAAKITLEEYALELFPPPPGPVVTQTMPLPLDPYTTRIDAATQLQGTQPLLQVGQPFDGFAVLSIASQSPDVQTQLVMLQPEPAPPGFDGQYFNLKARSHVTGFGNDGAPIDSFFDVVTQISLDGVTNGLHRRGQLLNVQAEIFGPNHVGLTFTGVFHPEPGLPPFVQKAHTLLDVGGMAVGIPCDPPASIVSANPPDGQRDARQDQTAAGVAEGLSSFTIFTDAPISIEPWDIVADSSIGNAPCVISVTPLAGNGHLVTLDRPITPRACTMFTVCNLAPPANMVRYEYLPADSSQNGSSNTQDLLASIAALNNGSANLPQNLHRYDTNRNGISNSQDLLRMIQLLNGVNSSQAWNGATLVPCGP